MKLCTTDVEIFLHFHAFLQADSGVGSLPTPALTSLKNPTDPPVVKSTEPRSMSERFIQELKDFTGHSCPLRGVNAAETTTVTQVDTSERGYLFAQLTNKARSSQSFHDTRDPERLEKRLFPPRLSSTARRRARLLANDFPKARAKCSVLERSARAELDRCVGSKPCLQL